MTAAIFIEWNESMFTGVKEIDRQHEVLVNVLNEIAAMGAESPGQRRLEEVTLDLLAYALYHFETEERLMQQSGYDRDQPGEAQAHVLQHRAFSDRVIALRAATAEGQERSQAALLQFLRDWLINHIGSTDRRLGDYISRSISRARR